MTTKSLLGAKRGMSAIPFIIVLILFVAAAYFAYSFYTDREESKLQVANARQKEATARSLALTAENINRGVAVDVGFAGTIGDAASVDVSSIGSMRADLMRKFQDIDKYGVNLTEDVTLETIIDRLQGALASKVTTIESLNADIVKKDGELAAATVKMNEAVAAVRTEKDNLDASLRAVEKERDENQAKAESESKRRRDDVDQLTEEKELARQEHAREVRTVKDELAYTEADLEQLKTKEDFVHARAKEMDGKVIDADVDGNFALVNLGKTDGLLEGTRFDVIRIIHGNVERHMGVIEVRKTYERYADCSLVDIVDPLNPVLPEDRIRNEIFDPKRVREFVFAGSVANSRYSKEELGKMIGNFGGVLEGEVDVNSDVVILGAGYEDDDNYKRGQELRLETMTEAELLRQLGR